MLFHNLWTTSKGSSTQCIHVDLLHRRMIKMNTLRAVQAEVLLTNRELSGSCATASGNAFLMALKTCRTTALSAEIPHLVPTLVQ